MLLKQERLLGILAGPFTDDVAALTPGRLVSGQRNHVREAAGGYRKPDYLLDARPLHTTPEICYTISGAVGIQLNDRGYRLRRGDICFIPAGTRHFETYVRRPGTYETFCLHKPAPNNVRTWAVHAKYGRGGYQYLNVLHFTFGWEGFTVFNPAPGRQAVPDFTDAKNDLIRLARILNREIAAGNVHFHQNHQTDKRRKQKQLPEIFAFIQEHLTENLTVAGLAERLSVTPRYLTELFRTEYGAPLKKYINDFRMHRALDLLEQTSGTVTEIAGTLGYSDEYYFSRIFKKNIGVSPAEYRRMYL